MIVEKKILAQVSRIIKTSDQIKRLKGESFNIFSVLRIETDEVTTHNRFIAELLNPMGSHGMEDTFLNLFYDAITESECNLSENKLEVIQNLRQSNVTVTSEDWLGNVNLIDVYGGSIDICIKSSNGQIRIENKIYAVDQDKQIARYCSNHEEEKNIIFYLTPFGHPPDERSSVNCKQGIDYFLLSHEKDTINWLDKCFRAASEFPILRETIRQYLILLKKITNQHTIKEMKEELLNILRESAENYKAAQQIANSLKEVQNKVYQKLISSLSDKLKKEKNLKMLNDQRRDGGFIHIKELKIEGGEKYDIGLNLELDNNYFFFCICKSGKRDITINKNPKFNNLASFLDSKAYTCRNVGNRNGYCLNGTFQLELDFSFEKYMFLSPDEKDEFENKVVKKLIETIQESELENY